MTEFSLPFFLPFLFLVLFGTLALLVGLWSAPDGWFRHAVTPGAMAIVGLLLALFAQISVLRVLPQFEGLAVTQLSAALTIDAYGTVFGMVACFATFLVVLSAIPFFADERSSEGEFYFLLLVSCGAACIAGYASDLLVIYLSIEFLGITSYVLAGFQKDKDRSLEAAIKYFLFGSGCSAAMLYGMSLVFGATGSINLVDINSAIWMGAGYSPQMLWIGIALVLVGIGFKLAAIPVHLWAPDVYEGAPTPVAAFLSIVSKAAGFIVGIRILLTAVGYHLDWQAAVAVVAAGSMILGNTAAILQRDLKRMLAYSSIAQAGYILIGVAAMAGGPSSHASMASTGVIVYLAGYLLANIGVFTCVAVVEKKLGFIRVDAFRGLFHSSPVLAVSLVIFFLSLAGVPPTLGFVGKFWVFAAAIQSAQPVLIWLAILGVANSVISVYYYFNVTRVMFFDEAPEPKSRISVDISSRSAIVFSAVATVALLVLLQPLAKAIDANNWLSFVPM